MGSELTGMIVFFPNKKQIMRRIPPTDSHIMTMQVNITDQ